MAHAALYRYRITLDSPLPVGRQWLNERQGLILALGRSTTPAGFGEAAPLPGFSAETLAEATAAALAALPRWLAGLPLPELPPSVDFALQSAVASLDRPLAAPLPTGSAPLLAGSAEAILARWRQWQGPRPAAIKLKVARQPPATEQHWLATLLAIAPVRLRLDANRGWRLEEALAFAAALAPEVAAAIDYIEEPLTDPELLPRWHACCHLPYALDESLAQALPAVRPAGLAALVAKPTQLGGDDRIARLAAQAAAWRVPLILSSCFESSLGLRHIARLAARYTPHQAPAVDTWQAFSCDLLTPLATPRHALALADLDCLWSSL